MFHQNAFKVSQTLSNGNSFLKALDSAFPFLSSIGSENSVGRHTPSTRPASVELHHLIPLPQKYSGQWGLDWWSNTFQRWMSIIPDSKMSNLKPSTILQR